MKTTFKALALVSLSLALTSVPAFARSIQVGLERTLDNVVINGKKAHNHYADVKLNFLQSTISVVVTHDPCPSPADPRMFRCLAMASVVETFEVPIQKRSTPCNSNVYAGVKDLRPVDGPRHEVKVSDHSNRICDDLQPGVLVVEAKSTLPFSPEKTTYLMY